MPRSWPPAVPAPNAKLRLQPRTTACSPTSTTAEAKFWSKLGIPFYGLEGFCKFVSINWEIPQEV